MIEELLKMASQFKELGVTVIMLALYVWKDIKFWEDMKQVNTNVTKAMTQNTKNQEDTQEVLQSMADSQQRMAIDITIIKERCSK